MPDLTGILRQTFIVPARTIKTIDFKDKQPNYFHIQNIGNDIIYFSVHGMPSTTYYDMKIDGGSIGTFTDTYQQPEAFIYNPSTEDVNVIMLSFSAPFDPAVLAQANKQITIGGTIETDGVVKGFQTPLPSGSNKIGSVAISGALPTGSNKIGKVEMTGTEFSNLAVKVSEIRTKLDSLSFDIGAVTVDEVNIKDDGVQGYIKNVSASSASNTSINAPDGYYISKIVGIITDNELACNFTNVDGYPAIGSMKFSSGEHNINLNCKATLITCIRPETSSADTVNGYIIAEIKPFKVSTETLTIMEWSKLKAGDKILSCTPATINGEEVTNLDIQTFNANNDVSIGGTIPDLEGYPVTGVFDWNSMQKIDSVTIERIVYSC